MAKIQLVLSLVYCLGVCPSILCAQQGQPCIDLSVQNAQVNCRGKLGLPGNTNVVLCGGYCNVAPGNQQPTCINARDMIQRQPTNSNPPIDLDEMLTPIPNPNPDVIKRKPRPAISSGLVTCGKNATCMCTIVGQNNNCSVDLNGPQEEFSINWYAGTGKVLCAFPNENP